MKNIHLFALTLAAVLTAAPAFAQQDTDKPAEAPKAQQEPAEKDKAVKPEHGSVKTQEAGQEKTKPEAHESKIPQSDREPAVKNESGDHRDANRMPQTDQEPAAQGRENHETRGNGSDRDRSAQYHFKGDEKAKLRSSYKGIDRVNRGQRVTIVQQQVLPVEVRTRIEPVPVEVVGYLPPAPEGFAFGFVDGYCVVYDPNTFFVIEVLDLD
jgi:hypothetical protein